MDFASKAISFLAVIKRERTQDYSCFGRTDLCCFTGYIACLKVLHRCLRTHGAKSSCFNFLFIGEKEPVEFVYEGNACLLINGKCG